MMGFLNSNPQITTHARKYRIHSQIIPRRWISKQKLGSFLPCHQKWWQSAINAVTCKTFLVTNKTRALARILKFIDGKKKKNFAKKLQKVAVLT
jgi:hypothetical protein